MGWLDVWNPVKLEKCISYALYFKMSHTYLHRNKASKCSGFQSVSTSSSVKINLNYFETKCLFL